MKTSCWFSRRLAPLLLLSLGPALLSAPRSLAQSPSRTPQTGQSPSTAATTVPTAQTEAEKKAAERKKRFGEQKALLDGGGGTSAGTVATHQAVVDSEFYMNPIAVNMVANESQELHVWDRRGTGNDVSARVSWGLSSSGIVDMTVNRYATITAKMPGTVNVTGNIDGHTVEATVTVYRGVKLPDGVPPAVAAPPPVHSGGRRNTMTVITNPN